VQFSWQLSLMAACALMSTLQSAIVTEMIADKQNEQTAWHWCSCKPPVVSDTTLVPHSAPAISKCSCEQTGVGDGVGAAVVSVGVCDGATLVGAAVMAVHFSTQLDVTDACSHTSTTH